MDTFDILQNVKDQLHEAGVSENALDELTATTTIEELIDFLNDCGLENRLYISII